MQHQRSLRGLIGSSISRSPFLRLHTRHVARRYQNSSSNDAPKWPVKDLDDLEEQKESRTPDLKQQHQHRLTGSLPIGVTSLGQPGKILVLPPMRPRKPREIDAPTSSLLSSMYDDLDSESLNIGADSVKAAFDSFRAELDPQQNLSSEGWVQIRSRLAASFTWDQLADYVEQNHSPTSSLEVEKQWKAGKLASSSKVLKGLKGKTLFAERILRNCWQLSRADEVGQLDLYMPNSALELLLNSLNFSFDSIAKMFQSGIDITLSLGLVRITGTEMACEQIREIIADASTRIREDSISIDLEASASALTPQFLDWVKESHEVSFEEKDGILQKVYFLVENQQGADNARRALNLAIYNSNQPQRSFATYLPSTQKANLYVYNSRNNLSWLDQEKQWFRWTTPPVQSSLLEAPELFFDNHPTRISDQLLKVLRKDSTLPLESESGVKLHESVTAAVGQCLFARGSPFTNPSFSAAELGALSLDRKFVNDIPRVNPFLETLKPVYIGTNFQLRRVRLIPPPSASESLPELEVEYFALSAQQSEHMEDIYDIIDIKQIKAIYETSGVEYLLPENGLDIHFTRTAYRKISNADLSESPEYELFEESIKAPLREASLASEKSFASGTSTSTPLPAFCHVSLPRDLVSPTASATSLDSNITVAYTFPVLDDVRDTAIHQYEYDTHILKFCLIERGPFNPSSIELSMDINLPSDGADEIPELAGEAFQSFYKDACDMAFEAHHVQSSIDE